MPVATFEREAQFRGTQTIDVFCEVRHKSSGGADQTYPFTQRALTFTAGSGTAPKTDARLSAISRPSFELSDRRGQMRGVSCTLDIIDTDYLIRGWLENPFQDNLHGVELTIWIIPEDQRKLGYTSQPYFRGIVNEPEFPPDRMVRFVCEDPFTAKFGELVPFYRVGVAEFPNAPTASLGVTVSPCYGDLADAGTNADPPMAEDEASSGAGQGPEHVAAGDPTASSGWVFNYQEGANRAGYKALGGTIPTGFSMVENLADGGDMHASVENVGMVTFTPSGGAEGDPHEFLPRDLTTLNLAATTSTISMTCTNVGAGTYKFYLGKIGDSLSGIDGVIRWVQRLSTSDPVTGVKFTRNNHAAGGSESSSTITPGATLLNSLGGWVFAVWAITADGPTGISTLIGFQQEGYRRPARLCFTPVAGATSYVAAISKVNPGVAGAGPTIILSASDFVRQWSIPTTSVNGAGDIVFEVDPVDTSTGTAISGLETPKNGIVPGVRVGPRVDLNGVTWEMFLFAHGDVDEIVSGYLNDEKIAASRFGDDILLPDMTGFSQMSATRTIDVGGYTFIAGFLRGAALTAYEDAGADGVFAINLIGVDGLLSIYDQLVHVADNFTLASVPYKAGAWNAAAAFADATLIINSASVAAAKALAPSLIPSGDTAGWFYRTEVTRQQLHADLHLSAHVDGGWQPSGQYRIAMWNQTTTPTRTITEIHDVVRQSFSFKDDYQQLETVIPYEARFDVRETEYELSAEYRQTAAIAKYGEKSLQGGPLAFRMRRALAPCSEMASLRALRYGVPVRLAPMEVAGFHALDLLPGDAIYVDHSDGSGTAASKGWTQRPVRVQAIAPDADGHKVGLVVEDYRQSTSLVGLEDVLANMSFGGDYEDSIVVDSGVNYMKNRRFARVNGALIPASYVRTPKVYVKSEAGSVRADIYDEGSNLIVTGTAMTSTSFVLATIPVVPYNAGVKEYHVRLTLAGGATVENTVAYGDLVVEP